jgi:hypothetical protein
MDWTGRVSILLPHSCPYGRFRPFSVNYFLIGISLCMSEHCQKNTRIGWDTCFHLQKTKHLYHLYFSFYNFLNYKKTELFNISHYAFVKYC